VHIKLWEATVRAQRFIAGAGLLAFSMAAGAGPFNYDETSLGDLRSESLTTLVADGGTNRLAGVVSYGSMAQEAPTFLGDRDPFALYVPRGVTINSVSLTMKPLYGTIQGSDWMVVKNGDFSHVIIDFTQSYQAYTQSWNVSLGEGTYWFLQSMGGNFDSAWTHSWTFDATGTAVAVPEPSMPLLWGMGLAALGLLLRKSRSQG
jgi:hypothetical protein